MKTVQSLGNNGRSWQV